MRFESYQHYLASREWKLLRRVVRLRSGGICERCLARPARDVHHCKGYWYQQRHERPDELIHLCVPCHEFEEALSDWDPCADPCVGLGPHHWFIMGTSAAWVPNACLPCQSMNRVCPAVVAWQKEQELAQQRKVQAWKDEAAAWHRQHPTFVPLSNEELCAMMDLRIEEMREQAEQNERDVTGADQLLASG